VKRLFIQSLRPTEKKQEDVDHARWLEKRTRFNKRAAIPNQGSGGKRESMGEAGAVLDQIGLGEIPERFDVKIGL